MYTRYHQHFLCVLILYYGIFKSSDSLPSRRLEVLLYGRMKERGASEGNTRFSFARPVLSRTHNF